MHVFGVRINFQIVQRKAVKYKNRIQVMTWSDINKISAFEISFRNPKLYSILWHQR